MAARVGSPGSAPGGAEARSPDAEDICELGRVDRARTSSICHDERSPEPAHVAAPTAGSRLCFACHSI